MKPCPTCNNGNGLWRYNHDGLICKHGHFLHEPAPAADVDMKLTPAKPQAPYIRPAAPEPPLTTWQNIKRKIARLLVRFRPNPRTRASN